MAVTNIGQANIVIRAITADFKNDVEKALKDIKPATKRIGEDVGRDFSKSVSKGMGGGGKSPFSRLEKEAEAARKTFNKLIKTGYALGPAISGAVSAVGDLVFGLFAVGSAVGAAAPALAVLPGLLAAIAQGALTAKLAFGGVAKGIGALLKQKTGSAAGGSSNDDAIADARRRLAMVYQQAAEKMAAANDKVRKAQIALNRAYEEGAESLQQLGFDAEDAALAQQKAAIELERARETLLRVQDLPPDSRARREAELAFKQADLDYRQAADRSNDLAKAQEYAAKTGIEGTSEVQSAKADLAEAEADLAKTQRDNAQDILEAQLALQKALQKTNASSATSVDLLKDLSAEARRFAIYIASLKPEFLELRAAAGEKLFGPLTIAIDMLVTKLFPVLKPILTEMGGVIGNIARKFAEMLTRVDNLDIFKRVFGGANIEIMRNLGEAFVDVAEGALNILDAVAPLTVEFSEFIKKTADAWVGTMRFKNATGELTTSFERAAEFAKSIGGLLSSAFGAFKSLGAGASDSGKKIIDAFAGAFDKLKAFADEGNRTGALQEKFNAIADNVIAIGGFLGEVAKMFYQISGNQGVMAFFNAIKPIPGIFADIFNKMTSTGPVFGEFLVNIALILKAFTETGGIQMFFQILNSAAKILIAAFNNETVQRVFLFLAAVKGVTLAFGALYAISKFFFFSTIASLALMPAKIFGVNGALARMNASLLLTQNRALGMQMAMGSQRFWKQAGVSVGTYVASLKTLAVEAYRTVVSIVLLGVESLKAAVKWLFSSASLRFFGGALKSLTFSIGTATKAMIKFNIALFANPIGLIVLAVAALVGVFVMAFKNSDKLRQSFATLGKSVMGTLGKAFALIGDALGSLMPSIGGFSDIFKAIGDGLAKYVMPVFSFLINNVIKVITSYILILIGIFKILFNVISAPFRIILGIGAVIVAIFTGKGFEAGQAFGKMMVGMLNGIIEGVNLLIKAFNFLSPKDIPLIPLMEGAKTATDNLTDSTKPLTDAQEDARRKMKETADSAANLNVQFGSLKDIQATVRGEIENTFDKVTEGARSLINARDAAKAFKEETDKLTTTMKDGTLSLGQKEDALYGYSASVLDAIKKDIELGGTQESTSAILKTGRDEFIKNAEKIGIMGDEAQKLADKLALTPATITKTFKASGLGDLQSMISSLESLESLANTATGREDMGGIGKKMQDLRATINTTMTVKFGKGNDRNTPLYAEVTNLPAKAVGGPVSADKTYLVGEKGPELFTSNSAGKITPNGQLGNMSGGNSAPTIIVNPSQGMDEVELAHNVSRQLAWTMRRGA